MIADGGARGRVVAGSTVGILTGAAAYLTVLFGFGFEPGRTANALGYGSNFFDLQARALMSGRLAVPDGSLGIEGFVIHGHTYMYFPPFPALVRLPVFLVTHEFDGRLTVASMAVAWLVFAVMSARFLWLARSLLRPDDPVTWRETAGAAVVLAAATGGTAVTFDAALPWVYHEVYAWSLAMMMAGVYWLTRFLIAPGGSALAWFTASTTAAIFTRSTSGFALSGAGLLVAAFLLLRSRARKAARARWWRGPGLVLAAAAALPNLASVALNEYKFGHPYLFPLADQVWTSVNEHRRMALAHNGGTITGPQFVPTMLSAYLDPTGIRFVDHFPWVTLPSSPPPALAGAYLDQSYRTGSVTAFEPLLTVLSVLGLVALLWPRGRTGTTRLRPAALAAVLLIGPVLMYGYVCNRYTSEFVPALVVLGSVGLIVLDTWLGRCRVGIRAAAMALVVSGAVFSLVAQMLLAYATAAVTWRGDRLEAYIEHQLTWGPRAAVRTAALVHRSDRLPDAAPTDQIQVLGDCDALYLGSGDTYEPWVLVQQRSLVYTVTADASVRPGLVVLFRVESNTTREIAIDVRADRYARLVVQDSQGRVDGPWFPLYSGFPVRVGLGVRSELGYAEVSTTPGGHVAYVPWTRWDANWVVRPGVISSAENARSNAARLGIQVTSAGRGPASLCEHLIALKRNP